MTGYEEALGRLLAAVEPLGVETRPPADCAGAHAAEDVAAAGDLPPFDNASMDGYAVRSADTAVVPARLRRVAVVGAGMPATVVVGPGECARIFTGAPLPPGADAVVMQEDTAALPDGTVLVNEGVKPWENVRFRGGDVRAGTRILSAGDRIGPARIALLAAAGVAGVRVHRRARVAVIAGGDELVPAGVTLGPGQIHESNAAALAALFATLGARVEVRPPVPDDMDVVAGAIARAFEEADVVVTAGGASVGDRDLIRPAFQKLGGELDFWKVAIRPGKPFFLGRLGPKRLLGVPGNPVSAFVTAVLLVLPVLRRLQGATDPGPAFHPARLSEPVANPGDRRHFLRVVTGPDGSVTPSGPQASHILSSLADADGLADIPAGASLPAGAVVRVTRW